jgi:hypothetical protein
VLRLTRPALAFAAVAAVVVALIFSPALRASAQAFLDLFRVRNFAAVSVDPARLERLHELNTQQGRDPALLVFDKIEELEKPGEPRIFLDAVAAGQAAGITVRVPATLPSGLTSDTVLVQGQGQARLTVDAGKLREVLRVLDLTDVQVPDGLDGAQITVRMPSSVVIPYTRDRLKAVLLQARSPEVSMPQGLDLERIGELGLRIAGLTAAEAHRFASTIDWRSTALVPVPTNASAFREVTVRGQKALLITTDGAPAGTGIQGRRGAVVMWTEGDMVYSLAGNVASEDLLVMANSLQ